MLLVLAIKDDDDLVQDQQLEQVQSYTQRVKGIQEIIGRDRMKVAFFGRYVYKISVMFIICKFAYQRR